MVGRMRLWLVTFSLSGLQFTAMALHQIPWSAAQAERSKRDEGKPRKLVGNEMQQKYFFVLLLEVRERTSPWMQIRVTPPPSNTTHDSLAISLM